MSDVKGEIVIARPVEEVFDFVADERNEPAYNPRMTRAEQVTDGPVGVGTRFVTTVRALRKPIDVHVEYTAYDRPRLLSSVSRMAAGEVHGTLTFEPDLAGTRMRWHWQLRPRRAARLLTPLFVVLGTRQEKAVWEGLKRHLEAARRA